MRYIAVSNLVDWFGCNHRSIEKIINVLDSNDKFSIPTGDLSIAFVEGDKIKELHKTFLDDDTITDVITFSGDEMFDSAGELVICPEYALDACKHFGQTFSEEITLYIIHGYLHLSGLNDISDSEKAEMRTGENYLMNLIKENNCIPNFTSKTK